MNPGFDPALALQLRELAPRVLGAVARRWSDFAAAEDAVQEALLAATCDWPQRGVPQNPGGWLFRVASRRLRDLCDAEAARAQREQQAAAERPAVAAPPEVSDDAFAAVGDDTLALLFLCCHASLTTASAIALTLRAVGGLSTQAIASAFGVPEATMAQRISRAKGTVKDAGASFVLPRPSELGASLGAVRHVLYLMFQEGHTSSAGAELLRADLAGEAIRLTRLLHRLLPEEPETMGLLALLLLSDARRAARTGAHGELIPLHEQDRSRWDRAAIAEGTALVTAAFGKGQVGSYQIQAAIASLHDEAESVAATDWAQILWLYTLLLRMTDSPVVALNRAVAVAMVHGPAAGLALVETLASDEHLAAGHRVDAVRAHLSELAGDTAAAIRHFLAAARCTANAAEQHYLLAKAQRLATP